MIIKNKTIYQKSMIKRGSKIQTSLPVAIRLNKSAVDRFKVNSK